MPPRASTLAFTPPEFVRDRAGGRVTFANASGIVSIGGPDEEYLLDVLGVQCDVRYLGDRTVSWRLPGFTPAGTAELTIAVAWSGPGDTLATWFAVGRH